MRVRTLLLSTVLCGGVAASAFAREGVAEQILQPASNWSVSRLDSKQGDTYCAVARKFSNDFVLTFARNLRDEMSVAIDFQKGQLVTADDYSVVLKPGYGESRPFNIRPVSDRAFVLRLGKDPEFNTAINRSHELTAEIAGSTYVFNIPDIEKGRSDMELCLAALSVEPAAGDEEPAVQAKTVDSASPPAAIPSAASVLTNEAKREAQRIVRADAAATSSEIDSLREENLRLSNALERERREFENRFMKEGEGSSAAAELQEKIKILETENRGLHERIAAAAKIPGEDVGKLAAENEGLRKKIEEMNAGLAKAGSETRAGREDAGKLAAEKASLLKQVEELNAQMAQTKKIVEDNGALNKQIETLKGSIAEAQKASEAGKAEIGKLAAENASLRERIGALTAKTAEAGTAIKADSEKVVAENASLRKQIEALNAKAAQGSVEGSAEKARLVAENDAFKKKVEELSARIVQIDTTPAVADGGEIERLTAENASLRQQVEALDLQVAQAGAVALTPEPPQASIDGDAAATITRLKERVTALESENTEMKNQTALAQPAAAGVEAITLSQLRSIESQLSAAEGERDRLAQELDAIRQGKADSRLDIAADNWNLEQATRRFNEAEREIRRLGMQLEQERSQCVAEKKEIEYKLFDPAIATREQIAKVADLEKKLEQATAQIEMRATEDGRMVSSAEQQAPAAYEVSYSGGFQGNPDAAAGIAAIEPASGDYSAEAYEPGIIEQTKLDSPPVSGLAATAGLMTASDIKSMLGAAGIESPGGIKSIGAATEKGAAAFSWESSGVFGSAEQKRMDGAQKLEPLVKQYLDKTRERCQGEFAAVPVLSEQDVNGQGVASYEIACVSQDSKSSASASILFHAHDGLFTTIANEASVDGMETAMDMRDRLLALVRKSGTAAN